MFGARNVAWHFLKPRLKDKDVVDLCCGDRWLQEKCRELPGFDRPKSYRGFDLKEGWDASNPEHWEEVTFFDLAVTVYGLQCLRGEEARAWLLLRERMGPDSRFLCIGNHAVPANIRVASDSSTRYNVEALRGLAFATGMQLLDYRTFLYLASPNEHFREADEVEANAFCATLRVHP